MPPPVTSWRGAVAVVLAVSVGVGWAVGFVLAVLHPETMSRTGAAVLYVLGGTLAGGVIGYLGGGTGRHRRERNDDE